MDNETKNISEDQEIGYEVMNATYDSSVADLEKLYYCQPDNSKAKTNVALPGYRNMVRVTISK